MNRFVVIFLVAILLIIAGFFLAKLIQDKAVVEINSFEDCLAAGYAVMESYPRQCLTSDGRSFIEDIGNILEKDDLIRVDFPRPGDTISSPLEIRGEARGFWYFEADFPVELLDGDGNRIPLDPPYIIAAEEWMTEDFVPFSSTHEFQVPDTDRGTLIFHRDNPSGLAENEDSLYFPVRFR